MYELIELGAGLRTAIFSAGDMPVGEERVLAIQKAATQRELQSVDARAALYKAEAAIGELLKPVDCPLQHLFAPGLYIRTIYIPANSVLVGKIHKHRHGNILSKGSVIVFTEQGGKQHLVGPMQMVSEPGTKRGVLAMTDTIWTTLHLNPTNTQDLAVLEKDIIAASYEEYEAFVRGEQT